MALKHKKKNSYYGLAWEKTLGYAPRWRSEVASVKAQHTCLSVVCTNSVYADLTYTTDCSGGGLTFVVMHDRYGHRHQGRTYITGSLEKKTKKKKHCTDVAWTKTSFVRHVTVKLVELVAGTVPDSEAGHLIHTPKCHRNLWHCARLPRALLRPATRSTDANADLRAVSRLSHRPRPRTRINALSHAGDCVHPRWLAIAVSTELTSPVSGRKVAWHENVLTLQQTDELQYLFDSLCIIFGNLPRGATLSQQERTRKKIKQIKQGETTPA